MPAYSVTVLPGRYAVVRLSPVASIPAWASGSTFCSITRTDDELSIICDQAMLPPGLPDEITVARDWALLRVNGPFAFDVTGVLAALAAPLAQAGVVILAVATYQTDYLLVKEEQLPLALETLSTAGHRLVP